eukprot:TRINITY_DN5233_c0_g1_i1.p2 TRINITY_DN5233_c0_g1~~TRINITY_DN5233_c0_g1_i1.p2  ORF type:complete len:390 (+),score=157.34 TRINITY_DN5233_c0_g1_i1:120-1172(+)
MRVLAKAAGAAVAKGTAPRYSLAEPPCTGVAEVVRGIFASAPSAATYLGGTAAEKREVDRWLDAVEQAAAAPEGELTKLGEHLTSATFLGNGLEPSAADLLWYDAVRGSLRKADPPSRARLLPVYRWAHCIELNAFRGELDAEFLGLPARPKAAKGKEKEKDKGQKDAGKAPQPAAGAKPPKGQPEKKQLEPSALDLRVGHIVDAWKHEQAEKLYTELIDVGEDKPRQICSGLAKLLPLDRVKGRDIIVFCNLKPATMVGVVSNGMVACSHDPANDSMVDFVAPPAGAKPGDRVVFEGYAGAPLDQVPPKKLPDLVAGLCTNAAGELCWKEARATVAGKPILGHKNALVR